MLVIFTGYNNRAVIALLRALRKNEFKDYALLAKDQNDPIFMTDYSDKVFHVRKHRELNKMELYRVFDELVSNCNDETVIVPTTEALNRFLVENKTEIESHGVTVPLVDGELYAEISDKQSFWKLCAGYGMRVPSNISFQEKYVQRYVAKPKKYISSSGERLIPVIVTNETEHFSFLSKNQISDYDIQEYVEGQSYYLLYYLSKGGVNYSFSQRNLAQQPGGKSIVAAMPDSVHELNISEEYINLLRSKGFFGFCMIELRKKNEDFVMIEANPRMWGPSQLYVDSGVPFLEAFLYDYGMINNIPDVYIKSDAKYFWSGGLQEDILKDKHCAWLDGGYEIVRENIDDFVLYDLYNRDDTERIYYEEKKGWERK